MTFNEQPVVSVLRTDRRIRVLKDQHRVMWEPQPFDEDERTRAISQHFQDRRSAKGALLTITRAALDLIRNDCAMLALEHVGKSRAKVVWTKDAKNLRSAM